jgi:hypothetical protein
VEGGADLRLAIDEDPAGEEHAVRSQLDILIINPALYENYNKR